MKKVKTFKEFIKEDPDDLYQTIGMGANMEEIRASWQDEDTITFGIVENVLYYTKPEYNLETHNELGDDIYAELDLDNANEQEFRDALVSDEYKFDFVSIGEPKFNKDRYFEMMMQGRDGFTSPGRLWTEKNLISFWWRFPDVSPYFTLIVKFLEEVNMDITKMKFEFIDGIKLFDWTELGMDKIDSRFARSKEDIEKDQAKQHVMSPLLKGKREGLPPKTRRGELSPAPGVQLSPGGRPVIGDSVEPFKKYLKK